MENTPSPQPPSRTPPSFSPQQHPVAPQQPYIPPQSFMQQQSPMPPSSSSPQHSPKRKRARNIKLASIGSILSVIVALITVIQFTFGIQNLASLIVRPSPMLTPKPTATPVPLPLIAESKVNEASPGCENGLPSDLAWYVWYVNVTCLPNDRGTQIDQKVNDFEPIFGIRPADDKHRFASNYSMGANLTHIAPNVCAGLFIGVTTKLAQDFLFLVCGNGDWYIVRTGTSGLPHTILQNTSATKEPASAHFTMEVAVAGNGFQMFVSGGTGQVPSGQDADFTQTQVIGIVFGEEGAVISNTNTTFLTSITAKDFYYEKQA